MSNLNETCYCVKHKNASRQQFKSTKDIQPKYRVSLKL